MPGDVQKLENRPRGVGDWQRQTTGGRVRPGTEQPRAPAKGRTTGCFVPCPDSHLGKGVERRPKPHPPHVCLSLERDHVPGCGNG